MLPALSGRAIRVEMHGSLGPHLAATSIPGRVIRLDAAVLSLSGDFERILIHEIFHFVWIRCSNATRRSWEQVLESELRSRARGELGWSAEWRKSKLTARDRTSRNPRWRRYVCESFCDSAAWLFAGLSRHAEFTLARSHRTRRRAWFARIFPATAPIPI